MRQNIPSTRCPLLLARCMSLSALHNLPQCQHASAQPNDHGYKPVDVSPHPAELSNKNEHTECCRRRVRLPLSLRACLQAYSTPAFFVDDWLNGYYDARAAARPGSQAVGSGAAQEEPPGGDGAAAGDGRQPDPCIATSDYRFVYLGPEVDICSISRLLVISPSSSHFPISTLLAGDQIVGPQEESGSKLILPQGTWTPLHADVLRSYSWSVNVAGAKRWLLLPPSYTHLLFDTSGASWRPPSTCRWAMVSQQQEGGEDTDS